MSGKLVISPVQAQLTRDTDLLSTMDPYVVVVCGTQSFKSNVCKNGGKLPNWQESFTFTRTNEDIINIQVWDNCTMGKNDMIGEGAIAFSKVALGKFSDWIPLAFKGKAAGKILLNAQFFQDVKSFPSTDVPLMNPTQNVVMGQPLNAPFTTTNQQTYQSFPQTSYPTFYQQNMPTQMTYPQQSFPMQPMMMPQQTYPTQTTTMPTMMPQQNYTPQTYTQQTYTQQTYTQPTYPMQPTFYPQQTYTQQAYIQPTVYPVQQTTFPMQPTITITQQQPTYYPQTGTVIQVVDYNNVTTKKKYRRGGNRIFMPIIGKVWSDSSSS